MSVVILCDDHHRFTNPVTSIDPNPKSLVGGKPFPPPSLGAQASPELGTF